MGWYTIPPADPLNALAETLGVWYDYVTLGFNIIGTRLGTCHALAVSPITDLTGRPSKSFLHLVWSPFVVVTIGKSFPGILSFCRGSWLLQIVLALWVKVLMALYLAERWWCLSHCKCWSVCMGFLYTIMENLPLFSCITMVSRKGMAPSSLLFSILFVEGNFVYFLPINMVRGLPN